MILQKWFLVIPPFGAARMVAQYASRAMLNRLGPENFKSFDSLTYQKSFIDLLKPGNETISVDLMNQSMIISCLHFGATHFITGALSPVTLFSLNLLKKQGITTAHWFYEDFRRATYWQSVISGYDYFFSIQMGPLPEICQKAGSIYHFLPTAHSPIHTSSETVERPFDIAFIGIPSDYRIGVLEGLAEAGFHLAIAGSGWKNYQGPLRKSIIQDTWTDEHRSFEILHKAKTGINLSVENPKGREDVHISPRVYDIIAAGCILISENVSLIRESLSECHYHTFDKPEVLPELAGNILKDYVQQVDLTMGNMEIVLRAHTYENRIDEILTIFER